MKYCTWIGCVLALALSPAVMATTDVLYIVNGDANDIQAIQGNSIIYENLDIPATSGSPRHYSIAVRETIWTSSYRVGEPGRIEFDSTLTPTGTSGSVVLLPGSPESIDGATNGVNNFTMNDLTGQIYSYNNDWSGDPVYMFTSACSNWCPGITYDPVNDSIWTADDVNINEYSMAGVFRGSFPHGDNAGGLAYEPSTDTLWLVDNTPANTLRQFSKGGVLLDTVITSSDYSNNVWGAEFRFSDSGPAVTTPVPTLSAWAIALLVGLMGLMVYARRRI